MRLELLGTSFCAPALRRAVLDQLLYKWEHSRRIIAEVLADKYQDLAAPVTRYGRSRSSATRRC